MMARGLSPFPPIRACQPYSLSPKECCDPIALQNIRAPFQLGSFCIVKTLAPPIDIGMEKTSLASAIQVVAGTHGGCPFGLCSKTVIIGRINIHAENYLAENSKQRVIAAIIF